MAFSFAESPAMESSLQKFVSFEFRIRAPLMRKRRHSVEVAAVSYQKFVNFALEETKSRTHLISSPLQEKYNSLKALDGKTELRMLSFQAPKIRFVRGLNIEGSEGMQVMDFAVLPQPAFDLPIFCANFFTTASMNIIVLDLNPLYDVIVHGDYKQKYYERLMPIAAKYTQLLPWGGKLTAESLKFFSPIVIWTKYKSSQYKHDILYSAFKDYYKAWLELMDQATEERDASRIICNREAQHKYLTWRAEKDPGHKILKKLVGEALAEDLVRSFLFNGVNTLGNKTFLDHFPEYRCEDGSVNARRSIIGKSFETRPWDTGGEFIASDFG